MPAVSIVLAIYRAIALQHDYYDYCKENQIVYHLPTTQLHIQFLRSKTCQTPLGRIYADTMERLCTAATTLEQIAHAVVGVTNMPFGRYMRAIWPHISDQLSIPDFQLFNSHILLIFALNADIIEGHRYTPEEKALFYYMIGKYVAKHFEGDIRKRSSSSDC